MSTRVWGDGIDGALGRAWGDGIGEEAPPEPPAAHEGLWFEAIDVNLNRIWGPLDVAPIEPTTERVFISSFRRRRR